MAETGLWLRLACGRDWPVAEIGFVNIYILNASIQIIVMIMKGGLVGCVGMSSVY